MNPCDNGSEGPFPGPPRLIRMGGETSRFFPTPGLSFPRPSPLQGQLATSTPFPLGNFLCFSWGFSPLSCYPAARLCPSRQPALFLGASIPSLSRASSTRS